MQVFRQDHNGVDHERALVPRDTERHPQVVRVVNHHRGCPVGERDREKIGAAWDEIAPVSNHRLMLSRISLRSIRATSYYYELLRATNFSISSSGTNSPRRAAAMPSRTAVRSSSDNR